MVLEPLLDAYFDRSLDVLLTAGGISFERRPHIPLGENTALFRAALTFPGPSFLHIRLEATVTDDTPIVSEYRFHYMDASNTTIFRYDNSDFHPGLPHEPHHKHEGPSERVIGCPQPSISAIRDEIVAYLKGTN